MLRALEIFVFFSIFSIVMGGLNFFVFSKLFNYFNLPINIYFYTIIVISSFSYIIAHFLEHSSPNIFTRKVYYMAAIMLGVVFISFSSVLLYEILTIFISIDPGFLLVFIFLTSLYSIINGAILKVKEFNIPISNLKKDIKAVHLSDIHIGSVRGEAYLEKIVQKTNQINPEVVFITGDLFDGTAPLTKDILKPFEKIKVPIFFSVGNHEQYEGISKVLAILKETNIKVLNPGMSTFKDLQILGVEFGERKNFLKKHLNNISYNKNKPVILLFHGPDNLEYASNNGVDLMLSGHTHSGQIFPFNLLVKLRYKRYKGLYKHKNSHLVVSTGTGTWGPPMRLGSNNQIIILNLKSSLE